MWTTILTRLNIITISPVSSVALVKVDKKGIPTKGNSHTAHAGQVHSNGGRCRCSYCCRYYPHWRCVHIVHHSQCVIFSTSSLSPTLSSSSPFMWCPCKGRSIIQMAANICQSVVSFHEGLKYVYFWTGHDGDDDDEDDDVDNNGDLLVGWKDSHQ